MKRRTEEKVCDGGEATWSDRRRGHHEESLIWHDRRGGRGSVLRDEREIRVDRPPATK